MSLPGKTEAGSAGMQPCRGITWWAHRDDDRAREFQLALTQNLIGSKDPHALKIPARQGGIHSLTENAASPVQAEPRHTDRIQFQLQAIRTYLDRKLSVETQRIMNLGSEPRNRGLVVAAERTITRLTERFELQMAKLDQTGNVRSKREAVGKGIILLEGAK